VAQLYTVAQIMAITGGQLLQGSPTTPVSGFAWDSRKVSPGDCFVAMPGAQVDGHDFTVAAVQAGAVCVLAGREVAAGTGALILTEDPLLALGKLGRHHRSRFPIPIVGVTGSVGKTTTKEMVAAVLAERLRVFRNPGNLNSEVGMPVALMGLDETHEVGVLEMGMRALGEITYLISIAAPSVGVVTNVGLSHLELLGSQANIALAKSELVRGLAPDGAAVLNADDPLVAGMAAVSPAPVWYYGFTAQSRGDRWVTAREIAREGEAGQRFVLVTSQGEAEAYLPAPGKYNVHNAMAAVAVALALGMDLGEAAVGLARYRPSGNRMRVVRLGSVRLLDDTYNAAPNSVIPALEVMREMAGTGRCVAVLGDMYELGEYQAQAHREVGVAAAQLADVIVTVGELARMIAEAAGPRAVASVSKNELVPVLKGLLQPGDTLLVKGSRGLALEDIVAVLEKELSV
jgi:UDP-N-acetylmuramoyl-tripeptide--D-alanyl-D-alanine ligase